MIYNFRFYLDPLYYDKTSDMQTLSNVNIIFRSHLYLLHYEKTSEFRTLLNVNAPSLISSCSHLRGFTVLNYILLPSSLSSRCSTAGTRLCALFLRSTAGGTQNCSSSVSELQGPAIGGAAADAPPAHPFSSAPLVLPTDPILSFRMTIRGPYLLLPLRLV